MAVILFVKPIDKTKAQILNIHYKPELLTEEQKSNGIMVDNYSRPEPMPHKNAVQYINPLTKEIWTEYFDREPTQEEIIQELVEKVNLILSKQNDVLRKQDELANRFN